MFNGPQATDLQRSLAASTAASPTLCAATDWPLSAAPVPLTATALATLRLPSISSLPEALPPVTRPPRLFNVSNAKRSVGGMFVEDQGGGYFAQSDLAARGTHVLDTGSTKLYVWFGCGEITPQVCVWGGRGGVGGHHSRVLPYC